MANPYDQNYFGDKYYSFDNNQNNGFQNMSQNRPQMRPQFGAKPDLNYNHNYGNKSGPNGQNGPVHNKANNYYRRTQHPYFGQKGGQYRAQVIDYTSGPQSQFTNEPIPRMPSNRFPNNNSHQFGAYNPMNSNQSSNNSTQPLMTRPQTGLLPPPHPYPNIRAYGQPLQQRGLLPPPPNQMVRQRFESYPPPTQQTNYSNHSNQSFTQCFPQSLSQPIPQPVSKPVPQPVPPPPPQAIPLRLPPVAKAVANHSIQPIGPNRPIKAEPDLQTQQRLEETRIKAIVCEGMESRTQNELRGFYCLFCEVFCNNLNAAERHVETPKHQRTKIGDNLKGIDAKFTIKSERISEMTVALARKEELNRISNVIKNEYYNEGIRLKDGIGSDAYICESCGVSLDSLSAVNKHLETHKQFADQLKICSKPIIGLDLITEYIDPDPTKPRVYECTMCRSYYSTREIISHVCSFLHRTNFIRKIHPSEGLKYTSESQQLSLEAGKRALELETLIGRGQFKVKPIAPPPNCLSHNKNNISIVSSDYNYNDSDDRVSTPKAVKPVIQIELPKQKSEQEKSELEKLFSVCLKSESEANEVTKVISDLTHSVMEYHMKDMSPQMRQRFKKQNSIN